MLDRGVAFQRGAQVLLRARVRVRVTPTFT
jgi:hypothetical protein